MSNNPVRIREQPHTQCKVCPIRQMSIFKGIPQQRLEWMQRYRQHQLRFSSKANLYTVGSRLDYVYTVFDGWMILYQATRIGKRQILRFVLPGDFIGFQAAQDGKVMHSAAALTDALVCAFSRSLLEEMMSVEPSVATSLIQKESHDISLYQHHLMSTGRKDAKGKIAFLLLELFHRVRIQMPKSFDEANYSIHFPVTQEELGDATGLTNVHVNRVLREFISDEYIECRNKSLRILNEDKLSDIAEFEVSMITEGALF